MDADMKAHLIETRQELLPFGDFSTCKQSIIISFIGTAHWFPKNNCNFRHYSGQFKLAEFCYVIERESPYSDATHIELYSVAQYHSIVSLCTCFYIETP